MQEAVTDGQARRIALPPILDVSAALALQGALAAALADGTAVEIDAGDVQRALTPGLQVLATAARAFEDRGAGFGFAACAPAFLEAVHTLALGPALGFHGD